MKIHENARLMPLRREEMLARRIIAGQMSRPEAVKSFGATAKTTSKQAGCPAPPTALSARQDRIACAGQGQGMPLSGPPLCGTIV